MSQSYRDYGAQYFVFAGTKKEFTIIFTDPDTAEPLDMTDSTLFHTATATIVKSSGEIIGNPVTANYNIDRTTGSLDWIIDVDISNNNNAGNWKVEVKLYDDNGEKIDEQIANFNILESS